MSASSWALDDTQNSRDQVSGCAIDTGIQPNTLSSVSQFVPVASSCFAVCSCCVSDCGSFVHMRTQSTCMRSKARMYYHALLNDFTRNCTCTVLRGSGRVAPRSCLYLILRNTTSPYRARRSPSPPTRHCIAYRRTTTVRISPARAPTLVDVILRRLVCCVSKPFCLVRRTSLFFSKKILFSFFDLMRFCFERISVSQLLQPSASLLAPFSSIPPSSYPFP